MKNKRSAKIRKSIADILRKIADKIVPLKAETKESTNEQEYREPLAPRILTEKDVHYSSVKELAYAVQQPECKNIAITGVYGSGKSSIINTYVQQLTDNQKRKILRISLCNFHNATNSSEVPDSEEYENEIEFKIFQHIFYKANQLKTSQTRVSRLSHINIGYTAILAIAVLLCVYAILIISWPNNAFISEHIHTWYANRLFCLFCPKNSIAWLVAAISYLSLVGVCLMTYILRRFHRVKLSKIKGDKIELEIPEDTSFFGKSLDEIIYFFIAGGYTIAIFEDLDRIFNPNTLFLKLRELNVLLNESDYYLRHNRKLCFIYAIKDDIFQGEVRTKFFDYIISVIPVVSKYNVGDFLCENYHSNLLKNVSETDLLVMGMYIENKRAQTNILNEYILNHDAIIPQDSLKSDAKFLAMLIYKNLFPTDYADVYNQKGFLFQMFAIKSKFNAPLLQENKHALETGKEEEQRIINNIFNLRHKVVSELAKDGISSLVINGEEYDLSEFERDDALFEKFERDKIDLCIHGDPLDYSEQKYVYKFKDLLSNLDEDNMFYEMMGSYQNDLSKIRYQREQLLQQIYFQSHKSLQLIFSELGIKRIKDVIKEDSLLSPISKFNFEVLHLFIRSGYISEDYESYMSYVYKGSLTSNDYLFVNSILQGAKLDYQFKIDNGDTILKRISSEHFQKVNVLNFSLLDYLYEHKQKNYISILLSTAKKDPKFIVEYSKVNKTYGARFSKKIFEDWIGCVSFIDSIEDAELKSEMFLLFFKALPTSIRLSQEEQQLLESKYAFLCGHSSEISLSSLPRFLAHFKLHFDKIQSPKADTQVLYNAIIKSNAYQLTSDNLNVILGEDFNTKAISTIMDSDSYIVEYVFNHINIVIPILPATSENENSQIIISLINNKHISQNVLEPYLAKQKTKINVLGITNIDWIPFIYQQDMVYPSWENVHNYFQSQDDPNVIIPFVKRHVDELKELKYEWNDDIVGELLFNDNNTLNINDYCQLAPCFDFKIENISEWSSLSDERLAILVNNNLLWYNSNNTQWIGENVGGLLPDYLICNFDEFKNDEDFDGSVFTNEIGLTFLNSKASLEQKEYMMAKYLFVDSSDSMAYEYAALYCYCADLLNDLHGLNPKHIISAMEIYHHEGDSVSEWRVKISLINKLNRILPFKVDVETRMLKTLHMKEYDKLTHNGSEIARLHDNDENRELLFFLRGQQYYVSNVQEPQDGHRRVSMIHKELKN